MKSTLLEKGATKWCHFLNFDFDYHVTRLEPPLKEGLQQFFKTKTQSNFVDVDRFTFLLVDAVNLQQAARFIRPLSNFFFLLENVFLFGFSIIFFSLFRGW